MIILLIVFFLILLISYFVIGIIYNSGNFSITLDKNLYFDKGLIIYDDPNYKVYRTELYAEAPKSFDNISYSVYNEYDYFNPVYLAQGWMKYGAASKISNKPFPKLFFNKKNSVNLHD